MIRLIYDTSIFMNANYYVLKKIGETITPERLAEAMTTQIVNIALHLQENNQVSEIVLAIDSRPSFRHKIWEYYKYGRKKMDVDKEAVIELLTFKKLRYEGLEADDIMYMYSQKHDNVVLITRDKDMLQCVRGTTLYYEYKKNELYSSSDIDANFEALQKIVYGDKGDMIPPCISKRTLSVSKLKQVILEIYDEIQPTSINKLYSALVERGYNIDYESFIFNRNMTVLDEKVISKQINNFYQILNEL